MKKIDSDALDILTKALGLTGRGAPITELLDSTVDQTLDVVPIVRRGRTLAGTQGLFTGIIRNIHAAANSIETGINPYTFGATGLISPYPNPVPPQFDIWLLGAILTRVSGSGTIRAILDAQYNTQGFGIDSAGAAVVATNTMVLAHWDAFVSEGIVFGVTAGGELAYMPINLRLPFTGSPGLALRSTSSAAITIDCQILMGLFPVALGQDGAF